MDALSMVIINHDNDRMKQCLGYGGGLKGCTILYKTNIGKELNFVN